MKIFSNKKYQKRVIKRSKRFKEPVRSGIIG